MKPLPMQEELPVEIPTVLGGVDYKEFKRQLERMDDLLRSGIEFEFLKLCLAEWEARGKEEAKKKRVAWQAPSAKQQQVMQRHTVVALRCNILRIIRGDDYRGFSIYLAESPLAQKFCNLSRLGTLKVPSKSTLERYDKWVSESVVRAVVDRMNSLAAQTAKDGEQALGLAEPVNIDAFFLDLTCVEANIHFPVDWLLLRDCARTLVGAIILIRKHGLRHRMPTPEDLLGDMNRLVIEMTHQRRGKKDARSERKRILRKMKKLTQVIGRHGERYVDLLTTRRTDTALSEAQAAQILQRMKNVLSQLPQAIKQAHERIIGNRQVRNSEKTFSLYDSDIQVIVRGKADAEVEFGNTLRLGELTCGLIVDWELIREQAPADSKALDPALAHFRSVFSRNPGAVAADRGVSSAANRNVLKKEDIFDAICPKDPQACQKRSDEPRFLKLLRRRAQTEGRIGIFKNCFLGNPLRSKGYEHRSIAVAWAVLAHNLWVLARLPVAEATAVEPRPMPVGAGAVVVKRRKAA